MEKTVNKAFDPMSAEPVSRYASFDLPEAPLAMPEQSLAISPRWRWLRPRLSLAPRGTA